MDSGGDPEALGFLPELAAERAARLEVLADESRVHLGGGGKRLDELALALHRCEPCDVRDEERVGGGAEVAAEGGGGCRAVERDPVVDGLEQRGRKALLLERAPRRVGDSDEPRAQARGRVVERAAHRPRQGLRAEVVLDVQVRDDRGPRGASSEPPQHRRGEVRVRVQDVHTLAAEQASQRERPAHLVQPSRAHPERAEPFGADELDERPVRRRDERNLVAARPGRPGELERH